MRVELVETGRGQRIEINLGGGMIHSVTKEEALVLANRIIELCRPAEEPVCKCGHERFSHSPTQAGYGECDIIGCDCNSYKSPNQN